MPWSENDYPDSMKNLSPAVRKDAIEIANAILKDGGDDGVAIATGIKQAKKKHHTSGVPMYYDMRKKAAEKCENDKSLAKETPLDGGKVVDNPAKIKDLKDIPIEKVGGETKVCPNCGGKGCEVCEAEGGKFKKGDGAVVADSEGSEGPGLQSFNNSLTNGGPAGSPNANQLAPVLGPKVSYYDVRKTAGDRDLAFDKGFINWWIKTHGETFKEMSGATEVNYEIAQNFLNSGTDERHYKELVKEYNRKSKASVSYYDLRPKKATVETVAGESPLRQVRQMLTQAASRIEQLRNSPEAKFEEGEAAALAKAEDLVEKARKILFDAQIDPPARKINEEAPITETAVEPPVAEPALVAEPSKV
jgi:hypothetical protein